MTASNFIYESGRNIGYSTAIINDKIEEIKERVKIKFINLERFLKNEPMLTTLRQKKIELRFKQLSPQKMKFLNQISSRESLPKDLYLEIFQYLSKEDLLKIALVSKTFYFESSRIEIWDPIGKKETRFNQNLWDDLKKDAQIVSKTMSGKQIYASTRKTYIACVPYIAD